VGHLTRHASATANNDVAGLSTSSTNPRRNATSCVFGRQIPDMKHAQVIAGTDMSIHPMEQIMLMRSLLIRLREEDFIVQIVPSEYI
jgi:hypothetical protein